MSIQREGPARQKFRRKVERLEYVVTLEPATRGFVPTTLRELVAWEDAALGLDAWSSFSVATLSGSNGDLRRRFDAVVKRLRNTSEPSPDQVDRSKREQASIISALAAQNHRLLEEKWALEGELERTRHLLGLTEANERKLIADLNKILPASQRIRSVGRDS